MVTLCNIDGFGLALMKLLFEKFHTSIPKKLPIIVYNRMRLRIIAPIIKKGLSWVIIVF